MEVTKRYAMLVEQHKLDQKRSGLRTGPKIKKKIIAAIKSVNKNESLDFWLTLFNKSLEVIKHDTLLQVHFSSKNL